MDKGFVIFLNNKVIGVFNHLILAKNFVNGCIQKNFFEKENIRIEEYAMNSCFLIVKKDFDNININSFNDKNEDDIVNIDLIKKKAKEKKNSEEEKKRIEDERRKKEDEKKKKEDEKKKKDEEKKKIDEEKKKIEEEIKNKKKEYESSEEYLKMQQSKIDLTHKINEIKYEKKRLEEMEIEYKNDLLLYNNFSKEKEKNFEFKIPELFELKFGIFEKLVRESNLNFINFREEWLKVKPKNNYDLFVSNNYEDTFVEDTIYEEIEMKI